MAVEDGRESGSPPTEIAEVSPAVEQVAPAVASKDVTPDPSAGKDESLIDRVKAALKPKPEGSSPLKDSQGAQAAPETPSEDDEKEPDSDPTEEEQARYHSKTRKQVKRLLNQRNAALDQVKELTPHAEAGRRVTSFIADSGMSPDEANLLLEVGRNMKRDPLKALEQLRPYYEALSRMSGDVLPADLQKDVTDGKATPEIARELARRRTETAVLSNRTQQSEQVRAQERQQQSTQQLAATVSSAISAWEANQAKGDPDWKLKQSRIGELVELDIRRSGYPKTAEAAIELAKASLAKVNTEFAALAPRKTNVSSVNPASAARVMAPKPTTALEAARQALSAG